LKLKNATYLKFQYITDGVMFFRYRRNDWSLFVGVAVAQKACARNSV